MLGWLFAGIGIIYLLALTAFWSILRVAGLADQDDLFDLEPDQPPRPCPLCRSSNVYVDTDDVCFCVTCRASYPLSNVSEAP